MMARSDVLIVQFPPFCENVAEPPTTCGPLDSAKTELLSSANPSANKINARVNMAIPSRVFFITYFFEYGKVCCPRSKFITE